MSFNVIVSFFREREKNKKEFYRRTGNESFLGRNDTIVSGIWWPNNRKISTRSCPSCMHVCLCVNVPAVDTVAIDRSGSVR